MSNSKKAQPAPRPPQHPKHHGAFPIDEFAGDLAYFFRWYVARHSVSLGERARETVAPLDALADALSACALAATPRRYNRAASNCRTAWKTVRPFLLRPLLSAILLPLDTPCSSYVSLRTSLSAGERLDLLDTDHARLLLEDVAALADYMATIVEKPQGKPTSPMRAFVEGLEPEKLAKVRADLDGAAKMIAGFMGIDSEEEGDNAAGDRVQKIRDQLRESLRPVRGSGAG